MTASARTGRPPLTSRADLLAAARHLGIEGLTVRKVTEAVGVKYSTFYRHFESLDELLAVLVDDVLSGVYLTTDGRWRMSLQLAAMDLARYAEAWPGLAEAMARLPERPWFSEAHSALTSVLTAAGLDEVRSARGARSVLLAAVVPPRLFLPDMVELLLDGLAARLGESVPS